MSNKLIMDWEQESSARSILMRARRERSDVFVKRTKAEQKRLDKVLERIAADELYMTTLEERKWDRLDFQEHAVWSIKSALEAGRKSVQV